MPKKEKNRWTYHVSHSYRNKDGKTVDFITQLYQIGVYCIINGDPKLQFGSTPKDIKSTEMKLLKLETKGEITELRFGRKITVIKNDNGFFEEV